MPFVLTIIIMIIPIKDHRWCHLREREREREREIDRERERENEREGGGGWHDHVPNDSSTYISFR